MPSDDTDVYRVVCTECGLHDRVEQGALLRSTDPELSAKRRRAGHISGGCPANAVSVEPAAGGDA